MGLSDEIVTDLNTNWDADIIAKPTLHAEPQFPTSKITRHLYVRADQPAQLFFATVELQTCTKRNPFTITAYEASEANAILTIKAVRKVLMAAHTGLFYRLETVQIQEDIKVTIIVIQGIQEKIISLTEW